MYKPLLYISNQDTVHYTRSLADKITYNKAGDEYRIDLNPKYHWSNGDPVTAQDFVFAWDLLVASGGTQTLFFPVAPEVASARYCARSLMNKSRVNVIVFANPPSRTVNV